jgi:hypothetical protein
MVMLDIFNTESEIRVATSLLEIFKKVGEMETINKKLVFLYAKEMTGESTNVITRVIKSMKSIYKDVLSEEMEKIRSKDIYTI